MKQPIAPPPALVVRRSLASHPIINPSVPQHKFGVIYTTVRPGAPSPQDFTPVQLLGATLENLDLVHEDPFFTIVGGYYTERIKENGERTVNISQLFGVATDPSQGFDLQPGNHMLGDTWRSEIIDDERGIALLDERSRGENGWTLIVAYRDKRRYYPNCHRSIRIFRTCPLLGQLTLIPQPPEAQTMQVQAQITVDQAADGYQWNWGDGQSSRTQTPSATHTYDRQPGTDQHLTVTCVAQGPGSCESQQQATVKVPGFCPVLAVERVETRLVSDQEAAVQLSLAVAHGTFATITVDWGDGSDPETLTGLTGTHRYARRFDHAGTYRLTISATGEGFCAETLTVPVQIAQPPCPVLLALVADPAEGTLEGEDRIRYQFQLTAGHGALAAYTWDWGDGSAPETIQGLRASHAYALPAGDPETRTVRVSGAAPGDCPAPAITLEVPIPGRCPSLQAVMVVAEETTETTHTVAAEVGVAGPMPSQFTWDWGDGSQPETTTTPTARHPYQRPAGDQARYTVSVSSQGPESCQAAAVQTQVLVPGRCPVLSGLTLELQQVEGRSHGVAAQARVDGPMPTRFEWDWGDGKGFVPGSGLSAVHLYQVPYGSVAHYTVKLRISGPDSCGAEVSADIELSNPCQTRLQLGATLQAAQGLMQPTLLRAEVTGPQPERFVWDLGEALGQQTTTEPELLVSFPIAGGEDRRYAVKVTGQGPDACRPEAKTDVLVPGRCPVLQPIEIEPPEGPSDPGQYEVRVRVAADPLLPTRYVWHWGDGSAPETTQTPEATHAYARAFGAGSVVELRVETDGPGTCQQARGAMLRVPGRCPELGALVGTAGKQTRTEQTFDFHLEVKLGGAHIERYEWTLGDWSEAITTEVPSLSHAYPREIGQDRSFTVMVRAIGPDSCVGQAEANVTVPAGEACPEILRLEAFTESEDDTHITLALMSVWRHGTPPELTWTLGDGSPALVGSEATVYHTYDKQSIEQELTVTVAGRGPQDCASEFSRKVRIPAKDEGRCPQLLRLEVLRQMEPNDRASEVELRAHFAGETPDAYAWTWQAGQPATQTAQPWVTLTLPRSALSDRSYDIKLRATGPDDCVSEGEIEVTVPQQPVEPVSAFCRLVPYLLAFLMALAFGALLITSVGSLTQSFVPGSGGVVGLELLLTVVAGVTILMLSRKRGCPPDRCDWLGMGWATALGGLMVSFFLLNCFNWVPVVLGLFAALGGLGYLWFRDCAKDEKAKVMFYFFAAGVVAGLLNGVLVARAGLTCM